MWNVWLGRESIRKEIRTVADSRDRLGLTEKGCRELPGGMEMFYFFMRYGFHGHIHLRNSLNYSLTICALPYRSISQKYINKKETNRRSLNYYITAKRIKNNGLQMFPQRKHWAQIISFVYFARRCISME